MPENAPGVRLAAHVARTVHDDRVLRAIAEVPRERFVPESSRPWAYEDEALSIGHGQTISQPTIVALMTEALALRGDERVLDVGTGSGYQAAILARLAREVVSVEIVDALRERATALLGDLQIDNVRVIAATEEIGAKDEGPFDAIVVAAAAPQAPSPLIEQLAIGGRLVMPIGSRDLQDLVVITRTEHGTRRRTLGPCRFVPLIGRYGFDAQAPGTRTG